jgi:integrase
MHSSPRQAAGYPAKEFHEDETEARSVLDLSRSLIYVPRELAKNHKSRVVPLNPELLEMFREMTKDAKPGAPVFGVKDIKRSFESAYKQAKIPKLTIHSLRHTSISRMIQGGENVVDVSEIAGHSDLKITMRYCHASMENKRRAVAKLGEIYGTSRKKLESPVPVLVTETPAIPS